MMQIAKLIYGFLNAIKKLDCRPFIVKEPKFPLVVNVPPTIGAGVESNKDKVTDEQEDPIIYDKELTVNVLDPARFCT